MRLSLSETVFSLSTDSVSFVRFGSFANREIVYKEFPRHQNFQMPYFLFMISPFSFPISGGKNSDPFKTTKWLVIAQCWAKKSGFEKTKEKVRFYEQLKIFSLFHLQPLNQGGKVFASIELFPKFLLMKTFFQELTKNLLFEEKLKILIGKKFMFLIFSSWKKSLQSLRRKL